MLKKIKKLFAWGLFYLCPINNKKVYVLNYAGRGYGDNAKYIVNELLKSAEDIDIIWSVKNDYEKRTLPENVISCKTGSIAEIYHLATAKIWLDNCRKGFVIKKKQQKYIQTWHGFALKRIEKDVKDVLPVTYVKSAIRDSKNIDIIVSDSIDMSNIYKNSFWYNGDIVEWGAPRNDIMINESGAIEQKVREKLRISDECGIILYAPTFRADLSMDAYLNDFDNLITVSEKKFNKKFVVVIRLHPNIAEKIEQFSFDKQKVIDGTFYPDLQELLVATDILVSDYSSLMFDYLIRKKACFIYASDIEEYKKDRNFYFNIEESPFSIAENSCELINNILMFDEEDYLKKAESFINEHGFVAEGNSSQKCAAWILKQINS